MTEAQARQASFDPFDVTKVWPHTEFPLIEIGRLVVNRNPSDYHAEIEQAAFSPGVFLCWFMVVGQRSAAGSLIPGIEPSPDSVRLIAISLV